MVEKIAMSVLVTTVGAIPTTIYAIQPAIISGRTGPLSGRSGAHAAPLRRGHPGHRWKSFCDGGSGPSRWLGRP